MVGNSLPPFFWGTIMNPLDPDYVAEKRLRMENNIKRTMEENRRVFNVHPRCPTNDGRHGFPIRWELRDYEMDDFDKLVKVPSPINGFVQW